MHLSTLGACAVGLKGILDPNCCSATYGCFAIPAYIVVEDVNVTEEPLARVGFLARKSSFEFFPKKDRKVDFPPPTARHACADTYINIILIYKKRPILQFATIATISRDNRCKL